MNRPHSEPLAPCQSLRVRTDGKLFRRGGARLKIRGVTYGPFRPNSGRNSLPEPEMVRTDFDQMRAAGINTVRVYHPPPGWFLDAAEAADILTLVEVPCPKHLDFLESAATRQEARQRVRDAVSAAAGRSHVLGCCIGNEISADLVRWYGAPRIESFLGELAAVAREADPGMLLTYASYPPTEHLELPFLDFTTFNVYLHDPATFRRYLLRLANQNCDRPLVLGEIGMDTLRHGEAAQAEFIRSHLREAALTGLAGGFVFSWTDDWFTNGCQIDDWAFGLTRKDRTPKPSYDAAAEIYHKSPAKLLALTPRVSVVVCSYNGEQTLEQCLRSLQTLDYPDYEIILVDDGSTDNTPGIAAKFPAVRNIRQKNCGLSAARNVGLAAATGDIIAYTDSDCFADADWLTLLVHQLEVSGAAAVGGPNLTPEDGWTAGCVAAAPGQPSHVLESDEIAEHIPGCNMAFRRDSLTAIGGFDINFRKAGDDVDVCWRLQSAGCKITFAPGAFVWHHRRQTVRAYLKQQAGYGAAEALLAQKHPERYSIFGGGIWRGVLYGGGFSSLRLGRPRIHSGLFGQGLFQTLYQPAPAHWLMLPATLEWQLLAVILGLAALGGFPTRNESFAMFAATLFITVLQAVQARPAAAHRGFAARAVIALLCWLQPLIRSGQRYRTRFGIPATPLPPAGDPATWPGPVARYLTTTGVDRAMLLTRAVEELRRRGHHPVLDPGWSRWDFDVICNQAMRLRVRTAQESYGGNSAQIIVRYQLQRSVRLNALALMAGVVVLLMALAHHGRFRQSEILGCAGAAMLFASWFWMWRCGRQLATKAAGIIDETARKLGLTPHRPSAESKKTVA